MGLTRSFCQNPAKKQTSSRSRGEDACPPLRTPLLPRHVSSYTIQSTVDDWSIFKPNPVLRSGLLHLVPNFLSTTRRHVTLRFNPAWVRARCGWTEGHGKEKSRGLSIPIAKTLLLVLLNERQQTVALNALWLRVSLLSVAPILDARQRRDADGLGAGGKPPRVEDCLRARTAGGRRRRRRKHGLLRAVASVALPLFRLCGRSRSRRLRWRRHGR